MQRLLCCAILLLVCMLVQVQGDCNTPDGPLTVGKHYRNCMRVTCHEDGTMSAVGCGVWRCAEGKQIGYRELDRNKPYPECCEGPICKD